MEYEEKKQSPWKGFWVICTLLVVVPVAFYLILRGAINAYQPYKPELNEATARAIGFGLGTIFHLSCFVAGAFSGAIRAVKFRVCDFFANLVVSVRYAFECYWDDMKSDGVVLLIVLAIMGIGLALCVDGLMDALGILGII